MTGVTDARLDEVIWISGGASDAETEEALLSREDDRGVVDDGLSIATR